MLWITRKKRQRRLRMFGQGRRDGRYPPVSSTFFLSVHPFMPAARKIGMMTTESPI